MRKNIATHATWHCLIDPRSQSSPRLISVSEPLSQIGTYSERTFIALWLTMKSPLVTVYQVGTRTTSVELLQIEKLRSLWKMFSLMLRIRLLCEIAKRWRLVDKLIKLSLWTAVDFFCFYLKHEKSIVLARWTEYSPGNIF